MSTQTANYYYLTSLNVGLSARSGREWLPESACQLMNSNKKNSTVFLLTTIQLLSTRCQQSVLNSIKAPVITLSPFLFLLLKEKMTGACVCQTIYQCSLFFILFTAFQQNTPFFLFGGQLIKKPFSPSFHSFLFCLNVDQQSSKTKNMRPKLAQASSAASTAAATTTTTVVSSSSASVPSTSQQTSSGVPITTSSLGGHINPVFISDHHLVESPSSSYHPQNIRGPPPPPPTKPKPTTTPKSSPQHHQHLFHQNIKKPRSSSSSSSTTQSSNSNNTVLTSASVEAANGVHGNNVDDNRRTLTTSSVEVGSNSTTELELNEVVRSSPSTTSTSVKHRLTTSAQSDLHPITSSNSSCDFCYRFHVNNHHHLQQSSRSGGGPIRRVSPHHHSSRPYYYDHHQPQYFQVQKSLWIFFKI